MIALTAAALTWLISGRDYPCGYYSGCILSLRPVLATPTAIMAAIGNATKHGFLVRERDALERLARVNVIAFDKTGTLTYGTPKVVAAILTAKIITMMIFTDLQPVPSSLSILEKQL